MSSIYKRSDKFCKNIYSICLNGLLSLGVSKQHFHSKQYSHWIVQLVKMGYFGVMLSCVSSKLSFLTSLRKVSVVIEKSVGSVTRERDRTSLQWSMGEW